jgi:peptide/nickel transport system permease protein
MELSASNSLKNFDMRFLSFLLQRSFYSVCLLLVLISMGFLLLHLSPGDIVDTLAGEMGGISEEVKIELRHHYGLDQPLGVQLLTYLKNVVQGDLGYSFYLKEPVFKVILERFPATALLFILALIFSVVIGTFLGNLASIKPDGFFSAAVTMLALVGYSAPAFWVGILLLLAFCVWIPFFPVAGMISMKLVMEGGSILAYVTDIAWHLILPLATLSIIYLADFSRLARASMIDVLKTDYIRMARVKGLPEHVVIFKHALRNAVLPVITAAGVRLGQVFSGAVVVETVFGWPGLGQLAFQSVLRRDYPTVLGILFFATLMVIVSNILTDLTYKVVDPRIEST